MRIVILLLFISLNLNGQIPQDKKLHFLCGTAAGWTGAWTSWVVIGTDTQKDRNTAFIIGVSTAITAGVAKELVYDKWMGRGTPEVKDLLFTVAGGIVGSGVIRIMMPKEQILFAGKNYKGIRLKL